MKKRSWITIEVLFVLIVCAVILLSFIQAARSYGSREVYYKTAIARDIALNIDSLYSIPGNARIEYGNDVSKYSILIKDNEVTVYKTAYGLTDATRGKYKFYGHNIQEIRIKDADNLIMEKKDETIRIYS